MSDYIKREDAIRAMAKAIGRIVYDAESISVHVMNSMPSADVVEVVRCEQCKYWDDRRNDEWWSEDGACLKTTRLGRATYRNADDFCSRGERRDNE